MALPAKRVPESLANLEIEIVAAALIRNDANVRNAAQALGVPSGDLRKLVLAEPGGDLDDSLNPAPGIPSGPAARIMVSAEKIKAGDIDGALNFAEQLPTEGPDALQDRTENVPVFKQPVTA